ncbi:MAG: hypothetical protein HZA90_22800 [Verrucomicrobia bacterium]|nr:hypothetical protein [Verrucomicrobiota bacterium]
MMLQLRSFAPALSGALLSLSLTAAIGATLEENFASDPAARGWERFGDPAAFHWNAADQALGVTWDSSKPNSFFLRPLGTVLTRGDDFSLSFDLRLSDFLAGVDPQKVSTFSVSVGLVNRAAATNANFLRGTGFDSPDLVEFSFFPDPGGAWQWGPSLTAVLIDSTGAHWGEGGFAPLALTSNDWYSITMTYTSSNSTLRTVMASNGVPFGAMSDTKLGASFLDFRVDHFAVCSYSDAGQFPGFEGSILAHGTVDNVVVITPPPPVQALTGALTNQQWRAQFTSQTNWLYTLERTTNLQAWAAISTEVAGTGTTQVFADTNVPAANAFYRVNARRP